MSGEDESSNQNIPNRNFGSMLEVKELRKADERSRKAGKKGLADYRKQQEQRFKEMSGAAETSYQKRSHKKVKLKRKGLRKADETSRKAEKKGLADYRKQQEQRFKDIPVTDETSHQKQKSSSFFSKLLKVFKKDSSSSSNNTNNTSDTNEQFEKERYSDSREGISEKSIQLKKGSQIYGFDDLI